MAGILTYLSDTLGRINTNATALEEQYATGSIFPKGSTISRTPYLALSTFTEAFDQLDQALGVPGRYAAAPFSTKPHPAVPPRFTEQVGGAAREITGREEAGLGFGFAAGFLIPGGVGKRVKTAEQIAAETSKFSNEAAALDKADDIAAAAKENFAGITDEEARALGQRYEASKDPGEIAEDLRTLASTGTPSPSPAAPGAPGAAASRPMRPTYQRETPAVSGPGASPSISSNPLYRALLESPTSFAQAARKAMLATIRVVQDSAAPGKYLIEAAGGAGDEAADFYMRQKLYPGIVGDLAEQAKNEGQQIFTGLAQTARTQGTSFEKLHEDLNDLLITRHAPERNKALGEKAAGITDQEAAARAAEIVNSPASRELTEAAERLMTLHRQSLDMLRTSGVISDELYTTLRTKYPNHVPLNRIMDETEDLAGALSPKGFDVKSTGIRRAVGSEREVADVVGNILYNYEQAVLRSQKNVVDQSILRFVRTHPEFSNIFEVTKPKAVGKGFDGKPILERTDDPQILQMYENGKPVWIRIKDKTLALALRGVNRTKLEPFLQLTRYLTNFYSGLQTRFNPEFFAPNKIRDLQEAMVYMASQKDLGGKGALKAAGRDPASIKAVSDYIRGIDSPGARAYKEMRQHGGTTGGMGLSTRKQVEMNVEDMIKTAQSKPRQFTKGFIEGVDNLNQVFEDSTRLSVYREALARGASKDRAAFLAKNATIDFNTMGTGGPVVNALYMFSNASIQGSAKMLRAMKNPKVAAGVITSIMAATAAVSEYNDAIDPDWRKRVTKWDRMNSLPIMIKGKDGKVSYVSIPVSWGLKPIKVMADKAYDSFSGQDVDPADAALEVFTAIAEGYNPAGGTDPISAAMPTFVGPVPTDMATEIARNQQWSGAKIRPDFDQDAPASIQYFDSLREKESGRIFTGITKELARHGIEISPADLNYGYEQTIGGAGRAINKTANLLWGIATPEKDMPPVSEFPLISRFYRERDLEEVSGTSQRDKIRQLEGESSRESFYRKQEASDIKKELDDMGSNAERKARLKALAAEDPELAKAVLRQITDDAANLTGDERRLKSATIETRAQLIQDELKGKSKAEQREILKNYADKKILTSKVLKRLTELQKGGT